MFTAAGLTFLLTLVCPIADTEGPPPLTFDKHVDYIEWYNKFVSQNKKDNAYELYRDISADPKEGRGFPALEGKAKEQCTEAMTRVWKAEDYPELAAYLKECAPHFETLKKIAQRPDYWQPATSETKLLFAMMMPNLSGGRTACQALLAHAMMKQQDQANVLIDACRTILRIADHMHQSALLIGELVGMTESGTVYQAASAAVGDGVIGGKDLATLYATIRQFDPSPAIRTSSLFVEQALRLDTLQHVCPNGKLDAERWKEILATNQGGADVKDRQTDFDPQEALRLLDEFSRGTLDAFSKPLNLQTARAFEQFQQDQTSKSKDNAFVFAIVPNLTRAYHLQLRTETMRRGTLLALAIQAHHAKLGKWPESLAKIDNQAPFGDLKALCEDPCSGAEFVYKLVDNQPRLYSVSSNGRDDGGWHDPQWGQYLKHSDYVFLPVPKAPVSSQPAQSDKPAATK